MLSKTAFGEYDLFTIINKNGMSISVTQLGATLQSVRVFDRKGALSDVILGYDSPEEYLKNDGYFGASVGRYANRIKGACFTLGGKEYKLTANDGKNTLHGGEGISFKRFTAHAGDNSVRFTLCDPDGADGFPGRLELAVEYSLSDDNELAISYSAVSDKDTVLNLTNHSYFNLRGHGAVTEHELWINADEYLPVDAELIPLASPAPVEGTAFDFREQRRIEHSFYDHCFVLHGDGACARLYEPESGRVMTVTTDMPAVQLYTAGAMTERRGKGGAVYSPAGALCLETQLFPDSPNRPDFPSCILKAGECYSSRTVFKFETD